jgi:hypothetical protein
MGTDSERYGLEVITHRPTSAGAMCTSQSARLLQSRSASAGPCAASSPARLTWLRSGGSSDRSSASAAAHLYHITIPLAPPYSLNTVLLKVESYNGAAAHAGAWAFSQASAAAASRAVYSGCRETLFSHYEAVTSFSTPSL